MRKIVSRVLLVCYATFLCQQVLAYDVTSGQSGAWYDPSHDGEGYFLQVVSESQAVVFWFSYDKSGNQFWMFGLGNIEGSKITFAELSSPLGGKFGPGFDPADVEYPVWGTLEFDFSTCNAATANYSGPSDFGSGTLNVTRLTSLWGLDCQGQDSNPQSTGLGFLNGGFSGSWFDPTHDGEGFVVEVLNETTVVVMWFTYDTDGNPAWLSGIGEIDGASIIVDEFQITSGGVFGPAFNPDNVVFENWGPAAFTYGSCGDNSASGNMRYIPPPEFGFESNLFLNRLVFIEGLQCDFLTQTYDVKASMNVAENIFIDSDVNDPNVPEISNDLDAPAPQVLVSPSKVVGYATAVPTEEILDRFFEETDEWDVYITTIKKAESILLTVSDWDDDDWGAIDLDLYLFNIEDTSEAVDTSVSLVQTEWVTAPEDGIYLVMVNAYAGSSNYLLRSGQTAPVTQVKLSSSVAMAGSELIVKLKSQNTIDIAGGKSGYKSRIEKLEKDNALTRIEASGDDEILYSVNTNRVDQLVPHPLTSFGFGSITPETWQVIRAAKALSASDDVRWAGPNYLQHTMAEPNDPFYQYQWHYPLIKLPQAWDVTTGSSDVVVAVIDTGVSDHPDLSGNVNYSLGFDFVSSTLSSGDGNGIDSDARDPGKSFPSFTDYQSHGTHVAGTIGASSNNGVGATGVAWNVTIMPIRVLNIEGSGDCWDIQQGMKWAGRITNSSGTLPAKQADIINMSLGGSTACPGYQELVNQLVAKDVVVVAASGNENSSVANYPASLNNVISVAATTFVDERAPYSSYGPNVDVAAPGGDTSADLNGDGYADGILSPIMKVEKGTATRSAEYSFLQGTSMASPHIAGIAALMKSVYPDMGSGEFFSAISSGEITVDLAQNGATNKDSSFGYGRIDVQKAVNWAKAQSQGQPAQTFLTSTISAANFGSNQESIDFQVVKAGSGTVSITGGGTTEEWIKLFTVSTDGAGLGTYRVTVDRTDLIVGSYTGWAVLEGSDNSQTWISVAMRVGEKVAGDAGYLYALLLDSWTLGNVKQWGGVNVNGEYLLSLDANPPGTYYLMIGSDVDHDYTICDAGEFCQIYPLNSQASEIVISNTNQQLGNFSMGFPESAESEDDLPAIFSSDSKTEQNDAPEISRQILKNGVRYK